MLRNARFAQQSHHLLTAILICLCAVSTAISVEPPQIDRLYPAGGQQGTSVNIELGGKPDNATLQSWCSHDQLQLVVVNDHGLHDVVAEHTSGAAAWHSATHGRAAVFNAQRAARLVA